MPRRTAAKAVAFLAAAAAAAASTSQAAETLEELSNSLTVTLPGTPLSTEDGPLGNPALTVLDAKVSTFTVDVSGMGDAVTEVELAWCYSAYSQANRAWRAPAGTISGNFNKQCKPVIGTYPVADLPVTEVVSENLGSSVVFLRAFGIDKDGTYVSYGDSDGYVEIQVYNFIDTQLIACAAVFSVIGPAILVTYFTMGWMKSKKH